MDERNTLRIDQNDRMDGMAWGCLTVMMIDRAGNVRPIAMRNTVVKGMYQFFLYRSQDVSEYAAKFVLGDDPTPTSFDTVYADMQPQYNQTLTSHTVDQVGLTETFVTNVPFQSANGPDPAGEYTYYEAAIVTDADRLLTRVAFRDEHGAIMGVTKKLEYRLVFTWTVGWGF
jgi:hypothetical protein